MVRVVDLSAVELLQLGNPLSDIVAIRIETLRLLERIKDPVIWLSLCARGGTLSSDTKIN